LSRRRSTQVSFKYLKVKIPRIFPCSSPVTFHLAKWILKVAEQSHHIPDPVQNHQEPVELL